MRCIEKYDELNRLKSVEFVDMPACGEILKSHGSSYLKATRALEELANMTSKSNILAYKYVLAHSTKPVPSYAAWVKKTCPLDQWPR